MNAAYRVPAFPRAKDDRTDDSPCVLSNEVGVLASESSLVITQVFSRLAGALADVEKAFTPNSPTAKFLKRSGFANILLNILTFVATYAAMDIQLSMDNSTLTRLKIRAPGERRTISAHVQINTGKWAQAATSARPLLNFFGLDFSLPNDGNVSGAKVTFVLQKDEGTGGAEAIFHNANMGAYFGDTNTTYSEPVGNVRLEPVETPLNTPTRTASRASMS